MAAWLKQAPGLVLTNGEVDALAAALWGAENGVDITTIVAMEIVAKNVLPPEFGYDKLEEVLARHPFAIDVFKVRWMLTNVLRGGHNDAPPGTTPKRRRSLLKALERGQLKMNMKLEERYRIWRMVLELRESGHDEPSAVALVARRVQMKEGTVRKSASLGRRMAGAAARPIGSTRKKKSD